MSEHPTESVPAATETDSDSQGVYRFWSNPNVNADQILASHRDGVISRCRCHPVVLAIQDTTDVNFTTHPATQGLGFMNQSKQQGMKVHSCLAVSGHGEPLGVLHQKTWSRSKRNGQRGKRRRKPIQQKESYRWLTTAKAAEQGMPDSVQLVHMGDREADIFELFTQPRAASSELLIRVTHNRRVQHELGYLIPTLNQAPVVGQITIELARNPTRPARMAHLRLRAMPITIEVPRHHPTPQSQHPVTLNAILVEEPDPPPGVEPVRWLLLTTLSITTFEEVWQCVVWYSYRWLIERFHFTLKSGCRFEDLQLQHRDRLRKALATYNIVAWRLMHLTYRARLEPDAPCDTVLQSHEWRLLRLKFAPKNRSKTPPTMRQAIRWIAQLGGFRARKGDGEPGLKTLWRGLTRFHHLLEGSQLGRKT